jgi:hypothetical protein
MIDSSSVSVRRGIVQFLLECYNSAGLLHVSDDGQNSTVLIDGQTFSMFWTSIALLLYWRACGGDHGMMATYGTYCMSAGQKGLLTSGGGKNYTRH